MAGDDDVAYGVPVLVPPSRKVSLDEGDAVTNDDDDHHHHHHPGSKKTTAAHIHASSGGEKNDEGPHHHLQLNEKDERIRALEQQYAELESRTIDSQNEIDDLKFRIQQQEDDKIELKTQLKIAAADARNAERRLRITLEERDHAMMVGIDNERMWMSTQLSNCEQQIHRLQNENIFLLNIVQEEQDKREQMMEAHLEELEQVRREQKIPIVAATTTTTTVERNDNDDSNDNSNDDSNDDSNNNSNDDTIDNSIDNDNDNDNNDPKKAKQPKRVLRFTRLKTKAKRAEDQRKKLAFETAKAYFAHQQQKRTVRDDYYYNNSTHPSSSSATASFPTSSSTNSERSVPPSSKGQADLLARHILEQQK
ncbi:MAG: hypothetical protein SGBAC_005975 [Bacillariaceae sp.]